MLKAKQTNIQVVSWLLRIGLAAVSMYAAIDAFREPDAWISYVPSFIAKFVDAKTALDAISISQIVLALWLLSGKYLRLAALGDIALLAGILIFNFDTILITFRDIGLVFMAAALLFIEEK